MTLNITNLKHLSVTDIETMSKEDLLLLYKQYFTNTNIPRSINTIRRILSYKLQETKLYRLRPKHQALLDALIDNPDHLSKQKTTFNYNINVGQRITKQYKGKELEVTKTTEGFTYNNKTYKSLSTIANIITGQKLSGYRFFNLRQRSKSKP